MYCIWIFSNKLDLNPETSFNYNILRSSYDNPNEWCLCYKCVLALASALAFSSVVNSDRKWFHNLEHHLLMTLESSFTCPLCPPALYCGCLQHLLLLKWPFYKLICLFEQSTLLRYLWKSTRPDQERSFISLAPWLVDRQSRGRGSDGHDPGGGGWHRGHQWGLRVGLSQRLQLDVLLVFDLPAVPFNSFIRHWRSSESKLERWSEVTRRATLRCFPIPT
jgi:hypothetical protein